MTIREARRRFFCFLYSKMICVLVLFGTPTHATAPALELSQMPHVPRPAVSEQSGKAKLAAKEAPHTATRTPVQVSRDQRMTVERVGQHKLSSRDIELLARLVYAEGRGEPYEGQVAIAAVVLNRLKSPHFPDTVRDVIFEPNAFTPARDGKLPARTNATARRAVWDAIRGKDPSKGSLYFFNPETSTSDWIFSRPRQVRIANHVFAR